MSSFGAVEAADEVAGLECTRRRGLFGAHALGTLGLALDRFAALRGPAGSPIAPQQIVMAVFAGDHGVAYAGGSAYQPDATAARISDLASGIGPVAQLATDAGVTVRAFDIALRQALPDSAVDDTYRVRSACGRIDIQDALSEDHLKAALAAGKAIADAEIDAGADVLIGAVCGVGVTTAADTLTSLITDIEPVLATTRGSGISDAGWINKCAAVRDARFRARDYRRKSAVLLRMVGGADLAALTGFIAQAAVRRTPVLVDDIPSLICAVIANRMAPGTKEYVIPANTTPHQTGAILRSRLQAPAILDQRVNISSGGAALLAVPQLRSAASLIDQAIDFGLPESRSEFAVRDWNAELT